MELLGVITYIAAIPETYINLITLTFGSSFFLVLITFHLKQYVRGFFIWDLRLYYWSSWRFRWRYSLVTIAFVLILILFFLCFLIELIRLILLTAFAVIRLHVIIGSSSELYQSYLAFVSDTNIFES